MSWAMSARKVPGSTSTLWVRPIRVPEVPARQTAGARSGRSGKWIWPTGRPSSTGEINGNMKMTGEVRLEKTEIGANDLPDTGKPKNQIFGWLRRKFCSLNGGAGV